MAETIVPLRRASLRARRASPAQHHAGAHNALTLAMLYLNRGDLAAAQRKVSQAMASMRQMQGVAHG
ncbi:MAG: hypothetical protein EOO27_07050 [Comamonadaceae bacterium]|nr:MAG: hypothetical protein EOO27_07050 [Comamonadaceae bacterium]